MKLNEGKKCTKIKMVDFTGNSEDQTVNFSDSCCGGDGVGCLVDSLIT